MIVELRGHVLGDRELESWQRSISAARSASAGQIVLMAVRLARDALHGLAPERLGGGRGADVVRLAVAPLLQLLLAFARGGAGGAAQAARRSGVPARAQDRSRPRSMADRTATSGATTFAVSFPRVGARGSLVGNSSGQRATTRAAIGAASHRDDRARPVARLMLCRGS